MQELIPKPVAVVDDEGQTRRALGRLLKAHGHAVALFEDGESFLTAWQQGASFAALILDLHMPGLGGLGLLGRLKAETREFRVCVITGKDEAGTEQKARQMGASAYLLKPVSEESLFQFLLQQAQAGSPR